MSPCGGSSGGLISTSWRAHRADNTVREFRDLGDLLCGCVSGSLPLAANLARRGLPRHAWPKTEAEHKISRGSARGKSPEVNLGVLGTQVRIHLDHAPPPGARSRPSLILSYSPPVRSRSLGPGGRWENNKCSQKAFGFRLVVRTK